MQDAFLSIVIDDIDLDDLSKLAWSQTNRVTPKKSEDDDEQDGKKGPVPPPTPKQQLQELYHHARACLIDSYRRHVLPRVR